MTTSKLDCSSPFTLPCGVKLPNRIFKAALSEGLADPRTNEPNAQLIQLYETWGKTGAAVCLTGNVMVVPDQLENPRAIAVPFDEDSSPQSFDLFQLLASKAQKNGTALWAQISHPGRQCPVSVTTQPYAPSDIPVKLKSLPIAFAKPTPLTKEQIKFIVSRFARSAAFLKKAGFSGVEIHGAHGYLISQFLSPLANKRTDEYGGSLLNRSRFLFEVIQAVREAVGPKFPVGLKLNSADFQRGGFTEDESIELIKQLEGKSLDFLEVSGGNYEAPTVLQSAQKQSTRQREAFYIEFTAKVRKHTKLPLMLTGGFRSAAAINSAISDNIVDFVGLGRPFCFQPHLIKDLVAGKSVNLDSAQLSIGVTDLSAGLENFWHQKQIHRISAGLQPDPNLSYLWPLGVAPLITYLWEPRRTKTKGWIKVGGYFTLILLVLLLLQNWSALLQFIVLGAFSFSYTFLFWKY